MTWEPRNKTDDDDAKLSDDDDDEKESMDKDDDELKKDDKDSRMTETKVEEGECQTELKSCEGGGAPKTVTAALSPIPAIHHGSPYAISKVEKNECALSLSSSKPKIWSLADTAASKTPPPIVGGGVGWLSGDTTFPLPPTIPPSQSQYSRFNHLASAGVNNGQYTSGYSSDSVGTDTPPQTPPNGHKSLTITPSQGIVVPAFSNNSINFGSNMSTCSRTAASGVESSIHQRYNATVALNATNHDVAASNSALHNHMFSSLYKNNHSHTTAVNNVQQQNVINNQVNQVQQSLQCQPVQQTTSVSGSYVS